MHRQAGHPQQKQQREKFIALGASRLGTSRVVKLAKAMEAGKEAKNDGSY